MSKPARPAYRTFNLRRVVLGADFRKSERTHLWSLPRAFSRTLKPGDAVCFVNSDLTLLRVVLAPRDGGGLTSVVHRYDGHRRFCGLTLQNVANDLGLHFEGLQRFEEHFPGLRDLAEKEGLL